MAEAAFGLHSVTDGFATVNMGEPGSPIPLPGGRGWEGCTLPRSRFIPSVCGAALEQGDGETWFPHPPTRWEELGGLHPPKKQVHPVGVRRS